MKYLVLTKHSKNLFGYDDPNILKLDIAMYPGDPPVKIYKKKTVAFVVVYEEISLKEFNTIWEEQKEILKKELNNEK